MTTAQEFIKVQPGKACKLVALVGAEWITKEIHSSWEQATDPYGNVIAYHDETGWRVASDLADTNVSRIIA